MHIDQYIINQHLDTTVDRILGTDTYRVIVYLTDDKSANTTATNITQSFVDYLRQENDIDLDVDSEIFRGYVLLCNGTVVTEGVV